MATRTMPGARWRSDRRFYSGVALVTSIVVFIGFAPSYYLAPWFDTPAGTPPFTTTLHVHGVVFTLWMLLSTVQPLLIAGGQRQLHRTFGYVGAGVAVAVVALGTYAGARAMHVGFIGLGDTREFFAIPFFAMVSFAVIVALAVPWRERAETHKRLMLLANTQLVEAAFARLFFAAGLPFPPLFFASADLIIVAGIAYDLASRGRVHAVWLWGGGLVVASQVLRVAVSTTEPWMAFAGAVKALV